ncbi:MAG TPA: tetratricopeptide repeat protein [Vicinamibacterales bacterium]
MSTRALLGLVLTSTLATGGHAFAQVVDNISHTNALTHYRLGEDLMHSEQFEKASAEFQSAIKLDPLLTIAHYELGQSYMAQRRYVEAIRAYIGCRTAFQSVAALVARNDFTADQRRDDEIRELKDAIGAVQSGRVKIASGREVVVARLEHRMLDLERMKQRGSTTFETPAEVSLALGSAYFRSGDLPSAEREWKAAVGVNSKLGEGHNNLAALYAMTGRRQEAEESVKQAEKAGYQVNPRLKSDIQALPKKQPGGA